MVCRGADSAVATSYFRVVLLPHTRSLPRFDPCATSTAVPELLGELLQAAGAVSARARDAQALNVVVHRSCRRKREQCDAHA